MIHSGMLWMVLWTPALWLSHPSSMEPGAVFNQPDFCTLLHAYTDGVLRLDRPVQACDCKLKSKAPSAQSHRRASSSTTSRTQHLLLLIDRLSPASRIPHGPGLLSCDRNSREAGGSSPRNRIVKDPPALSQHRYRKSCRATTRPGATDMHWSRSVAGGPAEVRLASIALQDPTHHAPPARQQTPSSQPIRHLPPPKEPSRFAHNPAPSSLLGAGLKRQSPDQLLVYAR